MRTFQPRARQAALLMVLATLLWGCESPEERAAGYMKQAQALYDQGDFAKARLEAQNAAQIQPKNAEARYLLALIAEKRNEVPQMIQQLAAAVDADPKMLKARIKFGTALFLAGAYDDAAAQSKAALELAPDDPAARVLAARIAFRNEGTEAGIRELDTALMADPLNTEALMLKAFALAATDADAGLAVVTDALAKAGDDRAKQRALRQMRAEILLKEKRYADLEAEYRALMAEDPEGGYEFRLADAYLQQDRTADAEKVIRDLVAAKPADEEARLALVRLLAFTRQGEAAEAFLKQSIQEQPGLTKLPLALGEIYEQSGKPAEAQAVYRELGKSAPKSEDGLEARNRVAALLQQAGDQAGAAALVEEILKDAPDNASALTIRADQRLAAGRYDEAVADLRNALRRKPDSQRALLLLARAQGNQGQLAMAEDAYRQLLQLNPDHREGLPEFGSLLITAGKYDEAIAVHQGLLQKQPGNELVLGRLIGIHLLKGDLDAAEAEARKLAAGPDQLGLGSQQLGRVLQARKDHAGAAAAFRKALEKAPDSSIAIQGLAESLANAGQKTAAREFVEGQLKKYPDQVQLRVMYAAALNTEGRTGDARAVLEKLITDNPKLGFAHSGLAATWPPGSQERIEILERGLQEIANDRDLTLLLGTEYLVAGRVDDSISLYEDILKVEPDLVPARNNLAALLSDFRKDKESHARAVELMQPFAESTDPGLLDTLGWAYFRNADHQKAMTYLERAVAAGGQSATIRFHLGSVYAAMKDEVRARQQLEEVLKLVGEGTAEAKEARRVLDGLSAS